MSENYLASFDTESFNVIKSKLISYRLDPFIREMETKGGPNKGLIFPFVRGLRFSALLIYSIRAALNGSNLEVSWGQIVDKEGFTCSGECDIIIHKKGFYKQWNGDGNGQHIMDFRFIKQEYAIAVISCKSYLTKSAIEVAYCKDMLSYVNRVWLFAECCGPESVELIREASKEIGYENFWHLYTWSRKTSDTVDDIKGWMHFLETIKSLV